MAMDARRRRKPRMPRPSAAAESGADAVSAAGAGMAAPGLVPRGRLALL
jgi:hypothetical protein